MAQYRADVWLGSASGRQEVVVNSNTSYGAKEQIMRIYGVGRDDIRNLYQVSGGSSSSSSAGGFGTMILLGMVVLFIGNCVPDDKTNTPTPNSQTEEVRSSQ